ncbi:glycosyltransferase family 2 protein [Patellaria atrata CBS 101060]|uniref:Glycosyltransferase family 2 protein n=1 Tax=Patellaria atrata CBS 101060 TaxID=1346257 RepID=A0A9P4VN39_9PEZI|nr:glycosyltransferase family 2 protein [Patellaria atrata CBS 101060]
MFSSEYLHACLFSFIWLFSYLRFIINLVVYYFLFKSIPVPEYPKYTPKDVTVVIPALLDEDVDSLRETIQSCLSNEPYELLLVTVTSNLHRAKELVASLPSNKIKVFDVAQPNKRRQMLRGIGEVTTPITIFADDDVTWSKRTLEYMLAPFEDPNMGGVGTNQRLRTDPTSKFWHTSYYFNFLGACYLQRRNFDCIACNHLDGGLPCLSGRTVAYRTEMLQDWNFMESFRNETWNGTYEQNADDDNFITRWCFAKKRKIRMQFDRECEVQTTLEDNVKFLKQCMRWSRSNWRSNLKSMFSEGNIWLLHPYTTYAVMQTTLTAWAPLRDLSLVYTLHHATQGSFLEWREAAFWALSLWWLFTKFAKFIPLYLREPAYILLLPVSIIFGWLHAIFIKLPAFFTLHVALHQTTWGTRQGADLDTGYGMRPLRHNDEIYDIEEKRSLLVNNY